MRRYLSRDGSALRGLAAATLLLSTGTSAVLPLTASVSLIALVTALPIGMWLSDAASAQDATPSQTRLQNAAEQNGPLSVALDEVSVVGQGGGRANEDPRGPIDGFVPSRSATATKTNTPLIETPQSITVVGRQQLDTQRDLTVGEALKHVPGVYGGPYGPGTRVDFFLIRGFTASDTGLYLNNLQLYNVFGSASFQVDPFGLERVEVLRGPAAVLFGQGGPGGLVNLVSKRPTMEPLHYVETGVGSFGQKYLAFDVGGPADQDGHWFYRITGIGHNGGTQLDGTDDNRGYIAPAITYKPDGATTFTVLTSYQHDESGRIGGFLPYIGTVRPQALGLRIPLNVNVNDPLQNRYRRTQAYAGYEFEHHFSDALTFRQNLRYAFSEAYDNTLIFSSYANPTQTVLNRYRSQTSGHATVFTIDNQLEARFETGSFQHTLLFGLDYKQGKLDGNSSRGSTTANLPSLQFNFLAPAYGVTAAGPTPYSVVGSFFQQVGVYAQDQIKLTPELTLVASGRGDFTENDVLNKLTNRTTEQTASAGTQRYGLIYNFDFGLAPYLSYASFFNPVVGTNFFNQPFKPETGDQYEMGVKYQPPETPLLFTAAAFDLIRTNVSTTDPNNINNTVQIGAVRSRGVELGIQANVTPDFNITASFTNYDLKTVADGSAARIGKTPAGIPQTLASVFADYTIPTGPLAGFGFGGGVRYIGSSYADVANSLRVPDFVLFDAQVHYVRDGWRFAVNATNIADRHYVSSCISANACYYGDARRVIASASYKW